MPRAQFGNWMTIKYLKAIPRSSLPLFPLRSVGRANMFTVDCDRLTKKEETPCWKTWITFCYLCITAAVGRIWDTSSSTHVAGLLCFLCDLLLVCAGWLPVCWGPWQQTRVSLTAHTVLLLSGGKAALLLPPPLIWHWCSSSLVLSSVIFMLCPPPCSGLTTCFAF